MYPSLQKPARGACALDGRLHVGGAIAKRGRAARTLVARLRRLEHTPVGDATVDNGDVGIVVLGVRGACAGRPHLERVVVRLRTRSVPLPGRLRDGDLGLGDFWVSEDKVPSKRDREVLGSRVGLERLGDVVYSIFLRVRGRHVGVAALEKRVRHLTLEHGVDRPLDKRVYGPVAPDARHSDPRLAMLMRC